MRGRAEHTETLRRLKRLREAAAEKNPYSLKMLDFHIAGVYGLRINPKYATEANFKDVAARLTKVFSEKVSKKLTRGVFQEAHLTTPFVSPCLRGLRTLVQQSSGETRKDGMVTARVLFEAEASLHRNEHVARYVTRLRLRMLLPGVVASARATLDALEHTQLRVRRDVAALARAACKRADDAAHSFDAHADVLLAMAAAARKGYAVAFQKEVDVAPQVSMLLACTASIVV